MMNEFDDYSLGPMADWQQTTDPSSGFGRLISNHVLFALRTYLFQVINITTTPILERRHGSNLSQQ